MLGSCCYVSLSSQGLVLGGQDTDRGCMIFNLPLHVAFPETTSKPEERHGATLSLYSIQVGKAGRTRSRESGYLISLPVVFIP